jgi:tetratricopeptide (TPR) repeat protein
MRSSRQFGALARLRWVIVIGGRSINPAVFLEVVAPLIEKRDVHGTVATIQQRWSVAEVATMLDSPNADARKMSALALSLIGTDSCIDVLARQLHDGDEMVTRMAEHAMWAIWLRGGTEDAQSHLARGTQLLADKQVEKSIDCFSQAILSDPHFAEAYNQRAMAYYLLERFDESLADCLTAARIQPAHFGAWAGAGHSHACLGNIPAALDCYKQAKVIHPRMDCLDDLIAELGE